MLVLSVPYADDETCRTFSHPVGTPREVLRRRLFLRVLECETPQKFVAVGRCRLIPERLSHRLHYYPLIHRFIQQAVYSVPSRFGTGFQRFPCFNDFQFISPFHPYKAATISLNASDSSCSSSSFVNGEKETRTTPSGSVPRYEWISGAHINPARVKIP